MNAKENIERRITREGLNITVGKGCSWGLSSKWAYGYYSSDGRRYYEPMRGFATLKELEADARAFARELLVRRMYERT